RTDLRLPSATLTVRDHRLVITDLRDDLVAAVEGDPRFGIVEVTHTLELGRLEQDYLRLYPISRVKVSTRGRRDADGTLRLDELTLDNGGGGTRLRLDGALVLPRALGGRPERVEARAEARAEPRLQPQPTGFKSLG